MSDYSELKRLAEACGNLNWRAIQENWTELAIRDDHGYIATMRTKSGKHAGPCSDREAKAKFLCSVTPVAVLALIAEVEGLRAQHGRDSAELRSLSQARDDARKERDQLKADNEELRKDAERYRWLRQYTVKSLAVSGALASLDRDIDAAMTKGAKS